MKRLAFIVLAIMIIIVQALVAPRLFSVPPNILLTITIVVTLLRGRYTGLLLAVMAGIVQDVLISNYFGIHLVSYVIVAYIGSLWSHSIYEEQWYMTGLWVGIGSLVALGIQISLLSIVREPVLPLLYLWNHGFPSILIDACIGIVMHKLLWKWEERDEYMW